MDAPILNWILFLGREVTTQVRRGTVLAGRIRSADQNRFAAPPFWVRRRFRGECSIWNAQEYKAAWELVKECVPHATVPYDPTSADSLRAPTPLINLMGDMGLRLTRK